MAYGKLPASPSPGGSSGCRRRTAEPPAGGIRNYTQNKPLSAFYSLPPLFSESPRSLGGVSPRRRQLIGVSAEANGRHGRKIPTHHQQREQDDATTPRVRFPAVIFLPLEEEQGAGHKQREKAVRRDEQRHHSVVPSV